MKWFIPVEDIYILEESTANPHEVSSSNIVALKSQASNVRDQLRQEEEKCAEDKVSIHSVMVKDQIKLSLPASIAKKISPTI